MKLNARLRREAQQAAERLAAHLAIAPVDAKRAKWAARQAAVLDALGALAAREKSRAERRAGQDWALSQASADAPMTGPAVWSPSSGRS